MQGRNQDRPVSRRRHPRFPVQPVYPAILAHDDGRHGARVVCISIGGIGLRLDNPAEPVGQRVVAHFDGAWAAGTVAWRDAGRLGMSFDNLEEGATVFRAVMQHEVNRATQALRAV